MSYDARIGRMRDQGLISEGQADRLARTIATVAAPAIHTPEARKKAWTAPIALAALVAAGALGIAMLPGGPPVPQIAQDVSQAFNQPQEIGQMGNSMQSGFSLALIVAFPLLLVIVWIAWLYNGLVSKEEAVFETWAQVESNYQRRADLIPNIIEAVSDYMRFEESTLGAIVDRRSDAQAAVPPEAAEELRRMIDEALAAQEDSSDVLGGIRGAPVDGEALQRLAEAQTGLGASMHRILALSENYPQLRSSDQVLALQAELEGTENRINVARMRFNEAASQFNAAIRRMPASLIASAGDFRRKAYFTAESGSDRPVNASLD